MTPSESGLNYASVSSKPHHPASGRLPGFPRSHCSGVGFSPNHLCPGGRGFESEKSSTVLTEKCTNSSVCFKEAGGSLQSRCSCAVSYQFVQKQQISTISLIR